MCTQTSKTFIEILQDENNEIRKKLNSNLNAQEMSNKTRHEPNINEIKRKPIYTKNVKTLRPGKVIINRI